MFDLASPIDFSCILDRAKARDDAFTAALGDISEPALTWACEARQSIEHQLMLADPDRDSVSISSEAGDIIRARLLRDLD